jgi:hypothetical protein
MISPPLQFAGVTAEFRGGATFASTGALSAAGKVVLRERSIITPDQIF